MCPFGSRKSQGPGTKGTKWGPGVRRTGLQCRLAPLDNIFRSPTLSLWLWQARKGFGWMLWCGRFGEDNVPGTKCQRRFGGNRLTGPAWPQGVAVFSAPWTSHRTNLQESPDSIVPGSTRPASAPGAALRRAGSQGTCVGFAGLLVQNHAVN